MKVIVPIDNHREMSLLRATLYHSTDITKEIHTATNGQQALNLFNEYFQGSKALPDVIVLDLNMPLTDGFEYVEIFRRLDLPAKEHVKVVIIPSRSDLMEEGRSKRLGAYNYFLKTQRPEHLMEALETW
jgi:DNA-binding response OmpR family regulator